MSLQLKAGARFQSVVCSTEIVVVKAPADPVDLCCGGAAEETIEVLVTKAGPGSLSLGDTVLVVKGAKPLPSSD